MIAGAPTESYAQNGTPDQLTEIAKSLWELAKKLNTECKDPEERLSRLYVENKDFSASFPLVVQCMVEPHQFFEKAFRRYLAEYAHKRGACDTIEKYSDLQAAYPAWAFYESHRHVSMAAVNEFRRDVAAGLVDEHNKKKKIHEEVLKEIERESKARRALLTKQIKEGISMAAPYIGPPADQR